MGSRKIIFGCIFVLLLMFLMPCISAIQHNLVKEEIKQSIIEKFESFNLNDLNDVEKTYKIKHPFLYVLIDIIISIRQVRGYILFLISTEYRDYGGWIPTLVVVHPIIFLRSLWLRL